jgi:UMF1 family MFS transporter
LFTLVLVREPTRPAEEVPEKYRGWPRPLALLAIGISRPLRTTMRVRRFRHLVIFLIAFMLYDDGIQTVINMAAIYGRVELKLPAVVLMLTVLIIQLIAAGGAVVFRRISQAIDVKPAIMLTLVIWTGVVLYAYFIDSATEFFILGVLVGLVLGGSQALSRSFYASMVPPEASAEFFAFYTVFSKFSSIWGPWVFAFMKQMTGSSRLAILSIGVFFLAGLLLLYFVDEKKAREARLAGAF